MEPKITILKAWSENNVYKLTYELNDAFPELYASIRASMLGYILHKSLYIKKFFDDNNYSPETLNVLVRSIPIRSKTNIASEYIMNVSNDSTFEDKEMHHLVTTKDIVVNEKGSTPNPFTRKEPINLTNIYPGSRIHILIGVDEGRATYNSCYSAVSYEEHQRNKKLSKFTSTIENNGEKPLQDVVHEAINFLKDTLEAFSSELQGCIAGGQTNVLLLSRAENEVTFEINKMSDNQSIPVLLQRLLVDEIEKKVREKKKNQLQFIKLDVPGPYERTKSSITLVFTKREYSSEAGTILLGVAQKLMKMLNSLLEQLA